MVFERTSVLFLIFVTELDIIRKENKKKRVKITISCYNYNT